MKKSKKLLTWAVGDFGVIIKAGFPTSTAAWEWAQTHGHSDALIFQTWI